MYGNPPVRLTTTSFALLALLDQLGEGTSYDIKQLIEKSISNFWQVPHTTAYEEPARLAAAGLLSTRQEEGGRRRRLYSLTEPGRRALREWAAEPRSDPPQLRDELMLKVFAGGDPAALVEGRVAWHRQKLEELQGYLEAVEGEPDWERSQRTLVAGVAYHRTMLELIESMRPPPS